jgi:N-acetyl-gamma-glutamyl-phosphate reductase
MPSVATATCPRSSRNLGKGFGAPVTVSFTPHLIPMNRGELETITVELAPGKTVEDLRTAYAARYAEEPFVHLLPDGVAPATRMVRGSNHVVLNAFADRIPAAPSSSSRSTIW